MNNNSTTPLSTPSPTIYTNNNSNYRGHARVVCFLLTKQCEGSKAWKHEYEACRSNPNRKLYKIKNNNNNNSAGSLYNVMVDDNACLALNNKHSSCWSEQAMCKNERSRGSVRCVNGRGSQITIVALRHLARCNLLNEIVAPAPGEQ